MTHAYQWVQWNRHKRVYDFVLALAVVGYLAAFVAVGMITHPPPGEIAPPVLVIRALGTLAILLLHFILLIGPLARFTTLAAPLLYNRRHLGVTFFVIALLHGLLSIVFYGGFGVRNPASAVLSAYGSFGSVSGFPFEILGLLALVIFFVMAATSHDFWLTNLGARFWKTLHMLVYVAYGLVMLHVALGALQSEPSVLYPAMLVFGAVLIAGAHLAAGWREWRRDAGAPHADTEWFHAADLDDIEDNAAKVVCLPGRERVAIVRHGGAVSAVSNVCAHQGGPLGEGRVIDGCLTCPWHGYQYLPAEGQSPPPFTETIPTYDVRVEGTRILIKPGANPPGTRVEPAKINAEDDA
ncbi:MAG: hypothetical protein DHS20C14_12130 [Phycisphaeraceae bacterium]|nr:MAG: hypothetical protein DHS20C14_12130 [Phycisphaeraceae bacterium]